MDMTARLSLPFIMPQQAQKHITHNEALQALDALVQPVVESRTNTHPPASPLPGEAFIVPPGAGGAWAGHSKEIAAWQAGAWLFYDPAPGWQAYVKAERTNVVFDDGEWTGLASAGAQDMLGINSTADVTNRLAVASPASLFTHDGNSHQLKLNKAGIGDTGSLLFQTGWTGHAEMGLMGDNGWRLKVSADGADWIEALGVDSASGRVRVGGPLQPATDNGASLGVSGARWSAIWAATGLIETSDARLKSDIAPSDLGLDFIRALRPVRYRWAVGGHESGADRAGRRTHYGLIAQEVRAALEMVGCADFGGHIKADPDDAESQEGLRYSAFIAPLIGAVQALAARIEALERPATSGSV